MKSFRITPSALKGIITPPPSKSHTLRAILFGMMGKGKTIVRNFLDSPDTEAMIAAVSSLGAQVAVSSDSLDIEGVAGHVQPAENVIDAGNSGQVLRFIGALAALSPAYTVITGDLSIRHNRPIQPLLDGLQQLGAFAASTRLDGYAPMILKGPLKPGKTTLDGEDSQPVSALLIAASFLPGPSEITVVNPGEKPWIDLTLSWMQRLSLQVKNDNYEHYTVGGKGAYQGFEVDIPTDFSSAAYPIAAALVTDSELTLRHIDMQDVQGDKKLIDVLIQMGARIEIDPAKKTLTVKKGPPLKGIRVDINDFIDAITILAVIGCFAEGTTEITNAAIARKKESDRIRAIATELAKMGARIQETPDGLIVHRSSLKGTHLQSYHDHRLVLSLSVAALGAAGASQIDEIACIAKTYPRFAADFQAIGAAIEEIG